jgi:DDE superfamily endonuclease
MTVDVSHRATARRIYHTTGFSKDEIADLCAFVHATGTSSDGADYPPVLGLFTSVAVTLTHLRRNHVQQELAEYCGVSQPAISRAITAITPELARVMRQFTPTAEALPSDEQLIVDGILVSCWSWDNHSELYSGKHHTTGLNIQVACDLAGRLRWISDPVEGCRHDSAALRLPGVLDGADTQNWIGGKGYTGLDMITPIRKPPHRELLDWEKKFNTAISKIRWKIEQTIANLKTWRILHTDYRRPLATFADTISAVIGLQLYRTA